MLDDEMKFEPRIFDLAMDWCRSVIHDDLDLPTLCVRIGETPVCAVCIVDYFEGWQTASDEFRSRARTSDGRAAVTEAERLIRGAQSGGIS